jgi:hypothetical protein
MAAIRAHFDGKVLVPDEPVDVPRDKPLRVEITVEEATDAMSRRVLGLQRGVAWTSADFDAPLPDEYWLGKG